MYDTSFNPHYACVKKILLFPLKRLRKLNDLPMVTKQISGRGQIVCMWSDAKAFCLRESFLQIYSSLNFDSE